MKTVDCLHLYEDAEFYDAEFASRSHEFSFYRQHAKASAGPVLELACGTGRLTLTIAADGVAIAGVDAAPNMIARAKAKAITAGLKVDWHVADIRTMALDRRFDLLFIATNALQHLFDLDSLVSFMARAREHLLPNGRLIVDVFNPAVDKLVRALSAPYPHKTFVAPDGARIDVVVASEYLPDSQTLRFILTYYCGARVVRTKDVRMRCFFPEELLGLCRLGGFAVEARFGDHESTPFRRDSPQQILVCRRAGG